MAASAAASRAGGAERRVTGRFGDLAGALNRPLTSYYLMVGSSALLIALGLLMVLSSSMVDSYADTGSAFSLFYKQIAAAAIGLPLMVIAANLPVRTFRLLGYPMMLGSIALMVITVFKGTEYYGATRWLEIAGVTVQASEPAKLAFALWGANVLARKEELKELVEWRHLLFPLLPGCAVLVLLVLIGTDLGTTLVLLTIFLALLWVVGAPGRLFVAMFGLALGLATIMIAVEPYRLTRVTSFMNPGSDPTGSGYQLQHGLYALGTGRIFGVGIGGSLEKWGYLPHGESDFIFAILGEELGMIGALLVVGLFGLLGFAGLRVASRVKEPFARLTAVSVTAWIVVQALVNIGTVIGVLPITGIPLPLVSAGGSSLIPTMLGLGVLLALARSEPDAKALLAARGPGRVQRALSWLGLDAVEPVRKKKGPVAQARSEARPTQSQTRRNRRR